jgi:hypothetical protein
LHPLNGVATCAAVKARARNAATLESSRSAQFATFEFIDDTSRWRLSTIEREGSAVLDASSASRRTVGSLE